ncbi:MAG TPA: toll/interleukin-1 receptor domain-containing protein [Ktedonobacteraceae bacterium]|jgi:outer membrane protein assembly factor BamB
MLDEHLAALRRQGLITSWHDGEIVAGTLWEKEIEAHLNAASIILLLISPAFIASDYCYSKEMQRALERHRLGRTRVIPILLRPVDWVATPFSQLQMLPTGARPITNWPDHDQALEDVAGGIRRVVDDLLTQKAAVPGLSVPDVLARRNRQGISRRMILGLAGLAAAAGSGRVLLQHVLSVSPTPAGTSTGTMFGYDGQRTHFYPEERVLSPGTVSRLVPLWIRDMGDQIRYSSPVVAGGFIYVGSEDHRLHALNATTGRVLWATATGNRIRSSPAVAGSVISVGSEDHRFYALDAATGRVLWTFLTGEAVSSSPVVAGSVVYAGSEDHKLSALDAATGQVLWTFLADNWITSSPAVARGVIYVGSWDHRLSALDAASGRVLWATATGDQIRYSSPAVQNNIVYVGSGDSRLYACDTASGRMIWTYTTGGSLADASPALQGGTVSIGSEDGKFYALDAASGQARWTATANAGISSAAAVANGVVYVGSWDHRLYVLDAATGRVLWTYTTGDQVRSAPTVANGVVYVGSWDHRLYAFHLPA